MKRAALLAVALLATSPASHASQLCADRGDFTKTLADDFGERLIWIGSADPGAVMELYSSPVTGTWTLVYVLPDGNMCMVAAGVRSETFIQRLPANL